MVILFICLSFNYSILVDKKWISVQTLERKEEKEYSGQ